LNQPQKDGAQDPKLFGENPATACQRHAGVDDVHVFLSHIEHRAADLEFVSGMKYRFVSDGRSNAAIQRTRLPGVQAIVCKQPNQVAGSS